MYAHFQRGVRNAVSTLILAAVLVMTCVPSPSQALEVSTDSEPPQQTRQEFPAVTDEVSQKPAKGETIKRPAGSRTFKPAEKIHADKEVDFPADI